MKQYQFLLPYLLIPIIGLLAVLALSQNFPVFSHTTGATSSHPKCTGEPAKT